MHKKTQNKIITFSTALALSFAIVIGIAPGAKALTISPPQIEFGVYPGQQADLEVKLYNEDAAQSVIVTTETTSFSSSADPGVPAFADAAAASDIASWIKLEKGPVSLEPLARRTVSVSVDVPENAEPGGHYGAILFTFKKANAANDAGQIAIDSKVATLLLVRIEGGDIVESATIKSFGTTGAQSWFPHLPVGFTTEFQNTGTIHLKPKGALTIVNTFGRQVSSIDFNTEKGATLPKEARRYDKEIWQVAQVDPLPGNVWSNFWTAYGNERSNFAIGKFTATLNLTAGTSGKVGASAVTTFYVFPWHVIVVYGIGIILLLILIVVVIKHYNAWILKRAKPTNAPPAEPKQ